MGKRERDTGKVDKTPSNPLSEDVARAIVTAASQEATDVLASMITDDPGKKPTKPKTLKDAVKDTVIQLVGCPTPACFSSPAQPGPAWAARIQQIRSHDFSPSYNAGCCRSRVVILDQRSTTSKATKRSSFLVSSHRAS